MLDPNDVSSLLELTRNIRNVKVPFHLCHTSLDNRVVAYFVHRGIGNLLSFTRRERL